MLRDVSLEEPRNTPFTESRQFYFGSLLKDSNTLRREWPHAHFQPALAWSSQHEENRRLLRIARKMVLTKAHRKIQRRVGVIATRRNDMVSIQLRKRRPVPQSHVSVH